MRWPGRRPTARRRHLFAARLVLCVAAQGAGVRAQQSGIDFVLDTYVRDGFVYYRALKADRRRVDEFVTALANADVDKRSKNEQIAFWLNAYDALVLQTVVSYYPT